MFEKWSSCDCVKLESYFEAGAGNKFHHRVSHSSAEAIHVSERQQIRLSTRRPVFLRCQPSDHSGETSNTITTDITFSSRSPILWPPWPPSEKLQLTFQHELYKRSKETFRTSQSEDEANKNTHQLGATWETECLRREGWLDRSRSKQRDHRRCMSIHR